MALRRCEACGGTLKRRVLHQYESPLLGLPGVVLIDAVEQIECSKCGAVAGIGIPNLAGAIAAAAVSRVKNPVKLAGHELRFLRKAAERTAKDLAKAVGVREESVSRWENGKEPIGPTSEKLIRILIGLDLVTNQGNLVTFDTEEIETMQLVPARPAGQTVRIALQLVHVSADHDGQQGAWEQRLKAA